MASAEEPSEVDSLFSEIRRLLMKSSQQEDVITSMHEVRVVDFEELKNHLRRGPKLLDI